MSRGGAVVKVDELSRHSSPEAQHRRPRRRTPIPRGGPTEFLYDDCGKNALQLAARGSTIIAELLRLSEHIPLAFTRPRQTEYGELIFDFVYFKQREALDKRIADTPELARLDEEFWQTHMELLDQFFKLFRSVFVYVTELNRFMDEIEQGLYVSQSIESIVGGSLDGVQLLSELHHLYGVMLLLLDEKIGGKTREHLLVSYIRYRGAGEALVVEVTQLCRSTGYESATYSQTASSCSSQKPDNGYPVAYFARVPVHTHVIRRLIDRLRSEDVYCMSKRYPLPEHRGAAMAAQGALLYTLLFFEPRLLSEEGPIMTEIVNKHFHDHWVINYYLGFTGDLAVAWESFPAARAAIRPTVALENVRHHQARICNALHKVSAELTDVLRDGLLTEAYALDNVFSKLLPLIREANVALRWSILHGTRGADKGQPFLARYADSYWLARQGISDDAVIMLLLKTSQLEFDLRTMFTELLEDKKRKWKRARKAAADKMQKLSAFFAGDNVLSREQENGQLCQWFGEVATRINSLQYYNGKRSNLNSERPQGEDGQHQQQKEDPAASARRRLQKLVKALDNAQEFSQVNASLQVVQYVQEGQALLEKMIRYINIDDNVLVTLATVGDFSYAWEQLSVHGYLVKDIQEKIKSKPALSVQMRSVFVKLASLIDLPCNRIDEACALCGNTGASRPQRRQQSGRGRRAAKQANNHDEEKIYDPRLLAALDATSSYYSGSLVAFVRRVLHVIPTSIFETLRKVMQLLIVDEVFKECPSKIAREDMKAMSQLPVRERLSTYTADIARYASGILAMESMRVGVIDVDSHQLLEDGVRRELVDQVARELHAGIQFDRRQPMTPAQLESELHRLGQRLSGIRASFEYIQDYINVHGLRIWVEEFARIVNFNVDMEANAFVSRKIYPWNSVYQSECTPIPFFEKLAQPNSTPATRSTAATAASSSTGAAATTGSRTARAGGPPPPQPSEVTASMQQPGDNSAPYGFLGHLVQHLLMLTDPAHAVYLSAVGSWYSRASLTEVVGFRTFSSIAAALGPAGLHAFDQLLCFIIAKDLQLALNAMRRAVNASTVNASDSATGTTPTDSTRPVVEVLREVASQLSQVNENGPARRETLRVYRTLGDVLGSSFAPVTQILVRVGRLQLMRKMLENEMRSCAKLSSGSLYAALRAANDAVLTDLCMPSERLPAHTLNPGLAHQREAAAEGQAFTASLFRVSEELAPFLDAVGLHDVLRQLFLSPAQQPPIPFVVLYLLGLVLRDTSQIFYDDRFSSCTPARVVDQADPASLLAGLAILLRQFHVSVTDSLVTCLAQSIRTTVCVYSERDVAGAVTTAAAASETANASAEANNRDVARKQMLAEVLPMHVETLASVLQLLFQFLDRPIEELQRVVPPTLFGDFRHQYNVVSVRQKPT